MTLQHVVLFSFPLIYYITSPEVYYRRPIDPFFVILAVVALLPTQAIGIGGRVAPPPLPHHRTCGSASGGSAD